MNKIILIGRLTHDVEMSHTTNDIAVAKDSIAVQRSYNKDETDFIPIVCWRKNAEVLYKYAKKGDKIAVTGELNTRKYETKEGEKRTAYEVVVDRVEILTPPAKEEKEEKKEKQAVVLQETLDDMPF